MRNFDLESHVQDTLNQHGGGRPARPDDPFIGGLTDSEPFALLEVEQNVVWDQLFAETAKDME